MRPEAGLALSLVYNLQTANTSPSAAFSTSWYRANSSQATAGMRWKMPFTSAAMEPMPTETTAPSRTPRHQTVIPSLLGLGGGLVAAEHHVGEGRADDDTGDGAEHGAGDHAAHPHTATHTAATPAAAGLPTLQWTS